MFLRYYGEYQLFIHGDAGYMGTPESTFVVATVITLILMAMVGGSTFLAKIGKAKGE